MSDLSSKLMSAFAPLRNRRARRAQARRGIATLWLILFLPVILIALCVVVEIGRVWLARAELEDGLEAAALAALSEWTLATDGTSFATDTLAAEAIADTYALSNSVLGAPLDLDSTEILVGTVPADTNGPFAETLINTDPMPSDPGYDAAVRVIATRTIPSQCLPWFSYSITSQATAVSRHSLATPHLIP